MSQTRSILTRVLAGLYIFTAIACMILGCIDVNDIYRHMAYFFRWAPKGFRYPWGYFVSYGVLLIAPAAVLLLSGIGMWTSTKRARAVLVTLGFTLPFILVAFIPRVAGGWTALYVAGPTASIVAALGYRGISYGKCAFWSSATLLACRVFILLRTRITYPPTLGSYLLWGQVEMTCSGLVLFCVLVSAARLALRARESRRTRKTFAA